MSRLTVCGPPFIATFKARSHTHSLELANISPHTWNWIACPSCRVCRSIHHDLLLKLAPSGRLGGNSTCSSLLWPAIDWGREGARGHKCDIQQNIASRDAQQWRFHTGKGPMICGSRACCHVWYGRPPGRHCWRVGKGEGGRVWGQCQTGTCEVNSKFNIMLMIMIIIIRYVPASTSCYAPYAFVSHIEAQSGLEKCSIWIHHNMFFN